MNFINFSSLSINDAITLSEKLLSIAVILQSLELLQIRSCWSEEGIWRWSTLSKELRGPLFKILFSTIGFTTLLVFRIISALMIWNHPHSYLNAFLFFSTWLISIRWRGLFNGGSDSMTIVVSIGLFAARAFIDRPAIAKYALAYIALQLTLSYLVAGVVKLKNSEWRTGLAMPIFLKTPRYDSPPDWVRHLFNQPTRSKIISCTIILIECIFPLSWIRPEICFIFVAFGFIFHLFNFWIFGLNRFLFAWLAAYPALYFWSQHL